MAFGRARFGADREEPYGPIGTAVDAMEFGARYDPGFQVTILEASVTRGILVFETFKKFIGGRSNYFGHGFFPRCGIRIIRIDGDEGR